MGERIVAELESAGSVDTLSRWMSHNLAELLQASEGGDETAKGEATELILKLWSHRGSWPDGWPPPATERLRRALSEPKAHSQQGKVEDRSFLACLPELSELQNEEYAIWLRLAVANPELGAELEQVAKYRDALDENERELFDSLSKRREAAVAYFAAKTERDDSAARLQLTRDELRRLGRRRQTLLKRAIAGYEGAKAS